MLKFLFWIAVYSGRPFGGIRPRRIVHWLARKAYGDAKPGPKDFRPFRDRDGNQLLLHPHYFIDYQVIAFGVYDAKLRCFLKRFVKPGMTCLDVGANIGCVTVLLSRLVGPSGRVFGFEPVPHLFERLRKNIGLNEFSANTSPHQLALSRQRGQATIKVAQQDYDNQGMASLRNTDHPQLATELVIHTDTLDEFARDNNIDHIDLLKMDVQGAEAWLIEGGASTLRRLHPHLLLEVSPYDIRSFGKTATDLLQMIEVLGYECYCLEENGELGKRVLATTTAGDFAADDLYCRPADIQGDRAS
jgi:FkbM family methyltransferase